MVRLAEMNVGSIYDIISKILLCTIYLKTICKGHYIDEGKCCRNVERRIKFHDGGHVFRGDRIFQSAIALTADVAADKTLPPRSHPLKPAMGCVGCHPQWRRIQDFVHEGPAEFWPQGAGPAQNRGFSLLTQTSHCIKGVGHATMKTINTAAKYPEHLPETHQWKYWEIFSRWRQ